MVLGTELIGGQILPTTTPVTHTSFSDAQATLSK